MKRKVLTLDAKTDFRIEGFPGSGEIVLVLALPDGGLIGDELHVPLSREIGRAMLDALGPDSGELAH